MSSKYFLSTVLAAILFGGERTLILCNFGRGVICNISGNFFELFIISTSDSGNVVFRDILSTAPVALLFNLFRECYEKHSCGIILNLD